MTIDQLYEKREKWVEANRENEFEEGIEYLLTILYPDNAHFIYELLQNAEDAGASEVRFILKADLCEFEHNGDKLFTIDDVKSITSIGSSTKADDPTNIGKFGIGFKAVFAYTNTPEIESGEFHFRIRDMVVPDTKGLHPGALGQRITRFVFPFDNPKKSSEKAAAEIEKNLRELNENTLLFLSKIRKVEYCLPDSTIGSLERKENANDENRIEIFIKSPENIAPAPTHYLRLTKDVNVKDEDGKSKCCRIAIAFGMDKSADDRWKISPLNLGQVSIYFPAVKETSNLRFHLHAPFASTVARDSVRECSANDELREHIADLIAESMHTIRDCGLLDVEFLAVLPNNRDNLLPFYLPIQERLIAEFNEKKLVPMKQGGHATGSECYRGPRALSDLISDKDLATLLGKNGSQSLWIANPQQINQREDNFLSMLDISLWSIENLVTVLDNQSDIVMEWLKGKVDDWHQSLYVLLGDFLSRAPSYPYSAARERKEKLSGLRIVRCSDGEYRAGHECYFPGDDVEYAPQEEGTQEGEFHYVATGTYSSGQNESQRKKARAFLEDVGVCELNEAEHVKVILRQRYEDPDTIIPSKLHEEDMKRFIDLVEKEPDRIALFENYNIFNTDGGDGYTAKWVYLDSPYLETGLRVYYEGDAYEKFIEEENVDPCFSLDYEQSTIDLEKLGKFAELLGAKTELEATPQSTMSHHKGDEFRDQGTGIWKGKTGIDEDFRILGFHILCDNPSIAKSNLIWQSMCSIPRNCLKARFRWNQSNELQEDYSSLVYDLKNAKWVPQKNENSISFVYPREALRDSLPGGFPYDEGQKWLELIEFGKTAKQQRLEDVLKKAKQNVQNQRANEFGFGSEDEAKKAADFFKEQGTTPDELLRKLHVQKRRKELLIIELSDAEEKRYEILARSIKTSGNTIDQRTALRVQYTTDENRMFCQMCSKGMPFKKRNINEDYFEAVEALGKAYFFKEHEAQYLALCPECAAKYTEFVKKDRNAREVFYDALKDSDNPQIHLESNGQTIRIWFEEKHWQDLKTVIYYYENVYDPDEVE